MTDKGSIGRRPSHPGEILRDIVLPGLNLSVSEAAMQLGMSRNNFSKLLNRHLSVSPEIAAKLELWLGEEVSRHYWLKLQYNYDLYQSATKEV